ncbi:MAG: SusC/RagA family TonB-linked outer membrane protein [Cyclobacteriaceae bacterium]
MKRILLLCFMFLTVFAFSALAQRTVSGTVTDDNGEGLPGVNVVIKGTTTGATTDLDGNYRLTVEDGATLIFSFVGFETQEIEVGARTVIDITMGGITELQEVVITGVGSATSKEKLSFVVEQIGEDMLQQTPGVSAVSGLAGKMAGVRVLNGSGAPGSEPNILIRGASNILRSNDPLIIIDGVLTEASLSDINGEDIKSIEVVKGAAAASLYGSRASNGVVNIQTRRGTDGKQGVTTVKVRSEFGKSFIPYKPNKTTSTNRVLNTQADVDADPSGATLLGYPSNQIKPDGIFDTPWPVVIDHFDQAFTTQDFFTQYVSIQNNSGNTAVFASAQFQKQEGIIILTDGSERTNLRLNIDHTLNEKLTFSASNLYSFSNVDLDGAVGSAVSTDPMFALWQLDPAADIFAPNEEDGTPYNWNANFFGLEVNPLYAINSVTNLEDRTRFLGNYTLSYSPLDWMDVEASFSIDKLNRNRNVFVDQGYLDTFSAGPNGPLGIVDYESFEIDSETLALNLNLYKQFGDLTAKFRAQFFYENRETLEIQAAGSNLAFKGKNTLENVDRTTITLNNNQTKITANNFSGILALDYRDTYLFDALVRRDGVSLFGDNERWQTFYRVSGGYRISQDFDLPGIQELKVRGSYGVAGGRPDFTDQYERIGLADGNSTGQFQTRNPNLKPSLNQELEVGFDVNFLDKFNFSFTYADAHNPDQIMQVPLSASTGFQQIVDNVATLDAKTFEMSLGASVFKNQDWDISANVVWDRTTMEITELNRAPFSVGPDNAFRIEAGQPFGLFYGEVLATSLSQVENQVAENQNVEDIFTINNHGFVVRKDQIGTDQEQVVYLRDDDGVLVLDVIGDITPDFNMGFNSTITWKNITLFMQWDWKQGGDVYNKTFQFGVRDNNVEFTDQALVPYAQRKSFTYINSIYNVNKVNSFFVEDGTFIKLRELALSYRLGSSALSKVGLDNAFKGIKVSAIGRNILTFTKYSGFDPEVGQANGSVGANIYRYDNFNYPNFATFTGSVEFTF